MSALLIVSAGIWASPSLPEWSAPAPGVAGAGPSPEAGPATAAGQRRRLEEVSARLAELTGQRARAEDLKRQLDAANAKLAAPRPESDDPELVAVRARADDLKRQLDEANARLSRPRPGAADQSERARADDLAAQVRTLSAQLARPRTPAPVPVVAPMSRDQLAARRGILGLYTAQAPFNFAETNLVETAIDRRFDLVGYFASWADPFRPDAVEDAWRQGRIPLLTWESRSDTGRATSADDPAYSLPAIIAGNHDDYLRTWARGIRDLGLPVVLRLDHEMNARWYPWSEVNGVTGASVNGNGRGDYARMWRHVHDVFEQEGANRFVVWLWSPNRVNQLASQPPPVEFYPGDAYVDWIGMSGYYRPYDDEATFDATFGRTLPLLRQASASRPIFLAEIGATELNGFKVAWIHDLFRGLAANPDIIGFAWFSQAITAPYNGELVTNDWRVNSTAAAAGAMREELAGSSFGRPLQ